MNNVMRLTKIQMLSWFDINKARFTKEKGQRTKTVFILFLSLFGMLSLAFLIYAQSYQLGSSSLGAVLPLLFYTAYFAVSFLSITMRGSSLYLSKDWEQNLSLPVTRGQLLLSKILLLYLWEIASAALFLLPCAVAYGQFMPVSALFPLWVALGVLVAPVFPLALGAILSIVVNFVFLRLPFKNILSSILGLGFVGVIIYFSMQSPNQMEVVLTDVGVALGQLENQFFPLATLFSAAFFEGNLLKILFFLLLTATSFSLFFFLLQKTHPIILEHLQTTKKKKRYTLEKKSTPPLLALLSKDLRHYFGNSAYLINTLSGGIIVILFAVYLLIRKEVFIMLAPYLGENFLPYIIAVAIVAMIHIGSITAVSISLEGSTLPLMKSLPVKPMTIFLSKILHQMIIFTPPSIIGYLILAIGLSFPLGSVALSLIFMLITSFLFAAIGIVINIHFPKLDWKTETQVIKQSAAVVLSMLIAVVIGGLLFALFFTLPLENATIRFLLCLLTTTALSALTLLYLKRGGTKKYQSIDV